MIVRRFPQRVGWMESKEYSDAAANVDSTDPNVPNVLNKKKYVMLNGRIYEKPIIPPTESPYERRRREIVENFSTPNLEQEVSYEQQVGLQNQARVQDFVSRGQRDKQNTVEDQRAKALRDEIKTQIGVLIDNARDQAKIGQFRADKNNAELVRTIHKLMDRVKAPEVNAMGVIPSEVDWEGTNLFDDLNGILGRSEDYFTDAEIEGIKNSLQQSEDDISDSDRKRKEALRELRQKKREIFSDIEQDIINLGLDPNDPTDKIVIQNMKDTLLDDSKPLQDARDEYLSTLQGIKTNVRNQKENIIRNIALLKQGYNAQKVAADEEASQELSRARNAEERARIKAEERELIRRYDNDYRNKVFRQEAMLNQIDATLRRVDNLEESINHKFEILGDSLRGMQSKSGPPVEDDVYGQVAEKIKEINAARQKAINQYLEQFPDATEDSEGIKDINDKYDTDIRDEEEKIGLNVVAAKAQEVPDTRPTPLGDSGDPIADVLLSVSGKREENDQYYQVLRSASLEPINQQDAEIGDFILYESTSTKGSLDIARDKSIYYPIVGKKSDGSFEIEIRYSTDGRSTKHIYKPPTKKTISEQPVFWRFVQDSDDKDSQPLSSLIRQNLIYSNLNYVTERGVPSGKQKLREKLLEIAGAQKKK